uniref:Protein HGH1 homolog n=2 Tax=Brassica oleracea var. oleracea TaxID=109376 RepID=A0A0D3CA26_BRAOL
MATELEELVEFLSSPSPPVKKAAVEIVSGLTGSEEGLQSLSKYSEILLPSLSRLLSESKEVSEPSAQALVNLSQNSELAGKMIQMGLIKVAMDMLYNPESCITRLLVMLLVNLTQLDDGVSSLLQIEDEKMRGLHIMKLVRSFCRSSGETADDEFEHVGSILVNVSKTEDGRKMLLEPKRGLLKQIIRQFDSTNQLRKKGVAGTIRNCSFEAKNQLENILLISEFLWPALLLPVAGSKIYSEEDISKMPPELGSALAIEREPVTDADIRVQTLEAIYLIILQEAGRRAFWSVNGPRILQVGYEYEEDSKVMRAYEQVGSLAVFDWSRRTYIHRILLEMMMTMGFEISDEFLGTFVPILVYWVYSGMYVCLGSLERYRLHSKVDEDEKNLVTKSAVVKGVLLQQTLQAIISVILFKITGSDDADASTTQQFSLLLLARQLIIAMLVIDTWQYFIHRYMHINKFLYKHIHSQHHRLIVPYSYGALYNHPLEGLLLDTIGGALSFLFSGMSPRTAIFFFSFATIKTVDDHCGLWLPGNPFHIFFSNNSAYHDVHHQLYGSKYNFSQPFFVLWDRILGTYLPYSLEKRATGGFETRPIKASKDE